MENDVYWSTVDLECEVWNTATPPPMDSLLDEMDGECDVPDVWAIDDV